MENINCFRNNKSGESGRTFKCFVLAANKNGTRIRKFHRQTAPCWDGFDCGVSCIGHRSIKLNNRRHLAFVELTDVHLGTDFWGCKFIERGKKGLEVWKGGGGG